MRNIRIFPHLTILAAACAVIGAGAVGLWLWHGTIAHAEELPRAARIKSVSGQVALNRNSDDKGSPDSKGTDANWTEATPNTPINVGDRIYASENSRAEIALTGRDFATVDSNTSLDVLELSDRRSQLALREGSATFDVGALDSGEFFEVGTPCGAIDLVQPGLYQVNIQNGVGTVSVLNGLAKVVGQGGTGEVRTGENITLGCSSGTPATLSKLDIDDAGRIVDDYYSYHSPKIYDGRYRDYDAYLKDPSYCDPSKRYASYQYVTDYVPGVEDLDGNGDWQNVDGYGQCWHPRVDAGWAPYQSGYWDTYYPYGTTWVSNEPWGFAPYHYGRWLYRDQWLWVPDRVQTRPYYSPALVAFVSLPGSGGIGWVALGPGDPYTPRYYDSNWQARYLDRSPVNGGGFANINAPGALTAVRAQDFGRDINRNRLMQVDPQTLAQTHPALDPMGISTVRQAALQAGGTRRRVDLQPEVARRLNATPVVTSGPVVAPSFRPNLAQALHAQPVPQGQKNQRLQTVDTRQGTVAKNAGNQTQPAQKQTQAQAGANGAADQQRVTALQAQAARGNPGARRELQQIQQQNRTQQTAGAPSQAQQQGRVSVQTADQSTAQTSRRANHQAAAQRPQQSAAPRAQPAQARHQASGPPQTVQTPRHQQAAQPPARQPPARSQAQARAAPGPVKHAQTEPAHAAAAPKAAPPPKAAAPKAAPPTRAAAPQPQPKPTPKGGEQRQ
jgi:hypothetical protein